MSCLNANVVDVMNEISVGATPATCMIFCIIGGIMSDMVGRKPTIILASVIFIAGTAILAFSNDQWLFLAGR